jgi:hypothetical protein
MRQEDGGGEVREALQGAKPPLFLLGANKAVAERGNIISGREKGLG